MKRVLTLSKHRSGEWPSSGPRGCPVRAHAHNHGPHPLQAGLPLGLRPHGAPLGREDTWARSPGLVLLLSPSSHPILSKSSGPVAALLGAPGQSIKPLWTPVSSLKTERAQVIKGCYLSDQRKGAVSPPQLMGRPRPGGSGAPSPPQPESPQPARRPRPFSGSSPFVLPTARPALAGRDLHLPGEGTELRGGGAC